MYEMNRLFIPLTFLYVRDSLVCMQAKAHLVDGKPAFFIAKKDLLQ